MPTIYEIRTKTGKIHKTKRKRAETMMRAWNIKNAAERDGQNQVEVREAVKRYLYSLGLSSNAYYNYLNCVMAMKEPIQTEMPVSGQRAIGS